MKDTDHFCVSFLSHFQPFQQGKLCSSKSLTMLLVRLAQAPSTTSVHHVHATSTHSMDDPTYGASHNTGASVRTNPRRTHSAPNLLCPQLITPLPPCISKPPTSRPYTRSPLLIPSSRSLPNLLALTTPTLLSAGPAGYVYTPTSMRPSRYESLRDDYGIRFRARGHRLRALLVGMRLKGSGDGREGGLGVWGFGEREGGKVRGWVEKKVGFENWFGRG